MQDALAGAPAKRLPTDLTGDLAWREIPLGKQSRLALQLLFLRGSESMGNHDSKIVDAGSVD